MRKSQQFEEWQIQQKTSSVYTMTFARNVAKKINRDIISYLDSGSYGSAYKVNGYKVMKITTDEHEAFTANNLIGENTRNIVKYNEVYKLSHKKLTKPTYVIIMEYLITLFEYDKNVRDFYDYFSVKVDFEFFFKCGNFDQHQIDIFKFNYFKDCKKCLTEEQVDFNLKKLNDIAKESRKYNIFPVDVHSGNLGFRIIDGDLIYFDVGINENYMKSELPKIEMFK